MRFSPSFTTAPRWTLRVRRPRSTWTSRSPRACATFTMPKVNLLPGTCRSAASSQALSTQPEHVRILPAKVRLLNILDCQAKIAPQSINLEQLPDSAEQSFPRRVQSKRKRGTRLSNCPEKASSIFRGEKAPGRCGPPRADWIARALMAANAIAYTQTTC